MNHCVMSHRSFAPARCFHLNYMISGLMVNKKVALRLLTYVNILIVRRFSSLHWLWLYTRRFEVTAEIQFEGRLEMSTFSLGEKCREMFQNKHLS